ncbi:MAG: alpha/beta hydrolase [Actinomycetota bacterium]|nr:alpha/beta hydrolase [Actinomycetota bacterium]
MTVSWVFLAVAVWGALLTLISYRPPRRPGWLMGASFFAAWITTELAVLHLLWQAAVVAVFIWAGALQAGPGWVALAITAVSWSALVASAIAARRTAQVFAAGIGDALGADWAATLDPTWAPAPYRLEWRRVVLPFRFRRKGVTRIKNLQYVDDGKRRHRLDVYRRTDARPAAPVLLQIHGGAWMIGNKDQQGMPLMYHLAARGWVCVAINYRLSPRGTWPDHLVDCKQALAWVRENIAQYGGDPDYVVVTGGSAGGHLTAMMGLTANDPQWQPGFEHVDTTVRAIVPFYGVYDWTNRFGYRTRSSDLGVILERYVVKQRLEDARAVYEAASPMNRIRPDAPPALVVHGTLDRLAPVEEAREFVRALRAVSTSRVAYVELPGTHHAFDVFQSIRTMHTVAAVDLFLSWLLTTHPPGSPAHQPGATKPA